MLALDADLNLLLGDYLDSTRAGRRARARARRSRASSRGCRARLAVLGNHDWRAAGPAMGWALRDAGVRVLENEAVARARRALGRRAWRARATASRDLGPRWRGVPEDAAVLLAVHDPDVFPDVPPRVALTVSGHLHGGQVNVPLLRRAVLPTRFGERYLAGHVVERGRHLYVSAGLGTAGLPLRLRRPPEVPVLRLTAAAPTPPAA